MPRKSQDTSTEKAPKNPFNKKGLFSEALIKFMDSKGMLPVKVGDFSFVRTGIYALDAALNGGLVRGWIMEIAGPNDRGKSTICQVIAANAVMMGSRVLYIDHEGTLKSKKWMRDMGIPLDQIWDGVGDYQDKLLHIIRPSSLEKGLELVRRVAEEDIYDIIIYDSIGRAPTEAMVETEVKQTSYSPMSRVMSDFSAKILEAMKDSRSTLIMINTVYTNPNQQWPDSNHPVGNMLVSRANATVGFMCAHRIWMLDPVKADWEWAEGSKKNKKKDGESEPAESSEETKSDRWVARRFPFSLWKSKSSYHPVKLGFKIRYNPNTDNYQLDVANDLVETAKELKVIQQRGAWLFMGDENIGSASTLESTIRNNPAFAQQLIERIDDAITANLAEFNAEEEPYEEPEAADIVDEGDPDVYLAEPRGD